MPEKSNNFKSGFVTLLGRPNAGKSTLLNTIIGQKIAITSDVVQTTRHRIRGILNNENSQIIFVDTPGLHKPIDVLGQELNESAFQASADCDVLAVLFDASQKIGSGDKWIVENIKNSSCKKICVLSKCDKVDDDAKLSQFEEARKLLDWDAIVCLSAQKNYNLDALIEEIESFLPVGPMWFPKDLSSDQPIEVMIAEYIREKIINNVYDEIPHSIGLEVESFEYSEKKNLYKIFAVAYVEKKSQKGIIIGKEGQAIKKISTEARVDLEKLLDAKVFLDLEVKLKKD